MSVAPELTMPVAFFKITLCCRVWLSVLLGNFIVDMSRVGINLS